jgi:type III secretion system FlhB-like substrate exporter
MKKTEYINIIYNGSAVEDGVIDVKNLASNLLSFANLVQRVSYLISDDKNIIDIKIKAMSKGSFDIALIMESISSWEQITNFFASKDYNAVKEILEILFGGTILGCGGIFQLYKFLKNKKPKNIKDNNNGTVTITNAEYQELIVSKEELKVFKDVEVRNATKEVIKDTLNKEGLESISFKTENKIEIITKEEAKYFDIPIQEDEEIIEHENIAIYSIISLTFKEDNKWTLNDGNTQIKATIIDESFLQKIENGEVAFTKYDKLKCRVLLKQNITDKLPKNDYTILEVLEHIKAFKQNSLNLF